MVRAAALGTVTSTSGGWDASRNRVIRALMVSSAMPVTCGIPNPAGAASKYCGAGSGVSRVPPKRASTEATRSFSKMPAAPFMKRSSHSFGGSVSELSRDGLAKLVGVQPDSATARVKSASAESTASIGTGLSTPPSTSSRPFTMIGVIAPGMATEARIATSTGPEVNHTSRRAPRSVATAV